MRSDPDFNWLTDDSVILEPRRALAVYLNQKGEVVLRQQADWPHDEDDIWIVFLANDAEHVANQIVQVARGPITPFNAPRHCRLTEGAEKSTKATDAPELFPNGGADDR